MLKIWGRKNSPNVQKVLWTCAETEQAFERIDHGGPFGGVDDPAYRAKNPNGLVPTLEDGDFVLWESSAIVRYLAARDPQQRLLPRGVQARAVVDQWIDWQIGHGGPSVRALVQLLLRPGAVPPSPDQVAIVGMGAEKTIAVLEHRLSASVFLGGADFTIADIINGAAVHRWKTLPLERPTFPAVDAWHKRLIARPAFAASVDLP